MEINLNDYLVIKGYIDNWIERFPDKCSLTNINEITIGLQCPLIVILYFFNYRFPDREDIKDKIELIKEFYKYTKIVELGDGKNY